MTFLPSRLRLGARQDIRIPAGRDFSAKIRIDRRLFQERSVGRILQLTLISFANIVTPIEMTAVCHQKNL
jgi:hypothetical protein